VFFMSFGIECPVFNFFGGYSEEETPVPIPNTEVKLFSADGTAWVTAWESRTPPKYFSYKPLASRGFFFVKRVSFVRRHPKFEAKWEIIWENGPF
jgi:hypothetical protein